MPPDRGRASKACTACRRQKTRCYEAAGGSACLRCERIGQQCSLFIERVTSTAPSGDRSENARVPQSPDDARFQRLEQIVERLSNRIAELEARDTTSSSQQLAQSLASEHTAEVMGGDKDLAPLLVLREVTAESGVRGLNQAGTTTLSRNFADDIISKGLIAIEEALTLLSIFQQHYGRWVSFGPLLSTSILLEDMRKSPLLLAACCLIAVRHTSQELAAQLAPILLKESETLLSLAILSTPQPIEFLQAALILSMWSTTIGQIPMSVDSWLLSSFALQHSIASGTLSPSLNEASSRSSRSVLDRLCIWNHLCLVHLHYCVGTRRKAMLDRNDIEQCRHILVNETSNFESRMVAEVFLYWIIYESSLHPIDLPKTQAALHAWKEEWKFLFDQPRSQFIQMGYHFAQLLTYDRSLKTRSAAVRETLLIEMVRLSTTIMKLAMDTADERTRHLTDHIYHMLSFAAVTLSRLLHKYEEQLAATHDLLELDRLVLSLAAWLHAIGLPCHIAHTMGSVVAAFHAKLRPEIESTSYIDVDPAIQDDFARFFPELFGDSPISSMQISMLPDFQPIP